MSLIDDDGNLFGAVNVIDAFVVLVLLAVILGGIAIVSSVGDDLEGDAESEIRYATVELGPQPGYVLERLEEGDVATINDDTGTLTVTEVYVIPSATDSPMNTTTAMDEQPANKTDQAETALAAEPGAMDRRIHPHVTIQAEATGEPHETRGGQEAFHVGTEPLRVGDVLELDMGTYVTNGTVTDLRDENDPLQIEETTTTAEIALQNISPVVASDLEVGMEETVHGEAHARITDVTDEPAAVVLESADGEIHEREHPQNRDVTLMVELRTQEGANGVQFRGEPLRIETTIVLDFDTVAVSGDIVDID